MIVAASKSTNSPLIESGQEKCPQLADFVQFEEFIGWVHVRLHNSSIFGSCLGSIRRNLHKPSRAGQSRPPNPRSGQAGPSRGAEEDRARRNTIGAARQVSPPCRSDE